jgi:polysaccharide export outer membrane protein
MPKLESTEFPSHPLERPLITLGPGDVIEVKYRYWPELNETQAVRPDGMISLQIVDEVQVTGLTPAQLDEHLTKLYVEHLKEPDITVIVRSQANQRIYVGGAVASPGILPINGNMTALEAIMSVGGFDVVTAEARSVVLLQNIDGKRYASLLNLKDAFYKPESEPYFLRSNDMLFVPRTMIVRLNQWVDQHITGLVPNSFRATRTRQGVNHSNNIGFTGNNNNRR